MTACPNRPVARLVTSEVECGTVTFDDEEGKRLDTVRYGRAPEYKKPTLTEQLDAELESLLAVRPDLEGIAMADGAEACCGRS